MYHMDLLRYLFILHGRQLLATGLLGEINVRTHYGSQRKAIYAIRERAE